MIRMKFRVFTCLAALAVCVVLAPPATAGYINFGGSSLGDFTTLGTVFWDPGANTDRIGGNPAPGGATWSIMGAGLADVSGFDPHSGASTTDLSVLYTGGVDEMTTIGLTLDKWAAVSGFTNLGMVADGGAGIGGLEAASGHLGDIRVGAIYIDGAVGSNVLAHAWSPGIQATYGDTLGGDMHFDDSNTWGDTPVAVGGVIDFHTVALHELGHSLGLGHSTVVGSVMEAFYGGPRRTLHADDIAGIVALYGAAPVGGAIPEPSTFVVWSLLSGFGLTLTWRRRRKVA